MSDCCTDENREQVYVMVSEDTRTVVEVCVECGRNHYRAEARPKSYGVEVDRG